MCGIAGVVGGGGYDTEILARLSEAISHRGPDDTGTWSENGRVGFVHRRLSIIDLSPSGHQPMHSDCGRYVIAYNGEIYNYRELRSELEAGGDRFRGGSDTEVLLAAFRRWGLDCVHRLNGMWAFAIWDRAEATLFASRDRLGKKPFYYVRRGDGLAFASEIKALLNARLAHAVPRAEAIADFAAQRISDHTAGTFFEGVFQLPAGHNMTWREGEPAISRYWSAESFASGARDTSPGEARDLLARAVSFRLRSDVPVGVLLSGGLDSSSVTCLAARQDAITAFSTLHDAEGRDEAKGIQLTAQRCPGLRQVIDRPDGAAFVADLENCLWHQEEPFADGSMVAHFRLMRLARESGVKVLLTGQGADEVFAGYPGFQAMYVGQLMQHGDIGVALRYLAETRRAGQGVPVRSWLGNSLPAAMQARLRHHRSRRSIDWLVPEARKPSEAAERDAAIGSLNGVLADYLGRRTLPSFLHYEDRNSMAHGVETRLPFLDRDVVERALETRAASLLSKGRTKGLLRDAMEGVVPDPIRNRLAKQGYPAPLAEWLRTAPALSWEDWQGAVASCPLLLPSQWGRYLGRFMAGDNACLPPVWRGLIVSLWHRRFVGA